MFTARAKLAIVFFIFGFSQVGCTMILLYSAKGIGTMYIVNDLDLGPLVVTGTQMKGETVIPGKASRTLRFHEPGEVTVTEGGTVIIQWLIDDRYFYHVRTHPKATLFRILGPIFMHQNGEELRLTMGGDGDFPGHFLTLNQNPDYTKQNISISSDNIAINQSSKQQNQNLAIKGGSERIVLNQDTTPENQNLSLSGKGVFSTLVNKTAGCIMITQTS